MTNNLERRKYWNFFHGYKIVQLQKLPTGGQNQANFVSKLTEIVNFLILFSFFEILPLSPILFNLNVQLILLLIQPQNRPDFGPQQTTFDAEQFCNYEKNSNTSSVPSNWPFLIFALKLWCYLQKGQSELQLWLRGSFFDKEHTT